MKNIRIIIYSLWATISLMLYLSIYLLSPSEELGIAGIGIQYINDGWTISSDEMVQEHMTLPAKVTANQGEVYTASIVLDEQYAGKSALRIFAEHQDTRVLIDGIEIYSCIMPEKSNIGLPTAKLWHIIEMPKDYTGKMLTIEIMSPLKAFAGRVNGVALGSTDDLLYELISGKALQILLAFFLLVFGIIFILVYTSTKQVSDLRLCYLGLYTMLISLWIFSETNLLQLFTNNRFIIGGTTSLVTLLSVVVFMLYLKEAIIPSYSKFLKFIMAFFLMDLVVSFLLQISGRAYLFTSITVSAVLTGICIISIGMILFFETFIAKSQKKRDSFIYLGFFLAAIIISIVMFLSEHYYAMNYTLSIGLFAYIILVAFDEIGEVNMMIRKRLKAEIYKEMALKDVLTKGWNRTSFSQDVDALINKGNKKNFRLSLMDMNGLKSINDSYGHKEGDKALLTCFRAIEKTFGQVGKCYRIGGDEFACIHNQTSKYIYDNVINELLKILEEKQEHLEYNIGAAIGTSVFKINGQQSFWEFFADIDKKMYDEKRKMKIADDEAIGGMIYENNK